MPNLAEQREAGESLPGSNLGHPMERKICKPLTFPPTLPGLLCLSGLTTPPWL